MLFNIDHLLHNPTDKPEYQRNDEKEAE